MQTKPPNSILFAVVLTCAAAGPNPASAQEQAQGTRPPVQRLQRPLRLLLVATAPTREFQFCLHLFNQLRDRNWAETAIYLQGRTAHTAFYPGVPAQRQLLRFPDQFEEDAPASAEEPFANLAQFDLLIAFDPDWSELTAGQLKHLTRWVEQGNGLIVEAGPLFAEQLADKRNAARLGPLLALLPVQPAVPPQGAARREADAPWSLQFAAARDGDLLRLDETRDEPLAGWNEYFHGENPATPLARGFFCYTPAAAVQPLAKVHASVGLADARLTTGGAQPFLATLETGRGRTVYLAAGETWRLRSCRSRFYERLWINLGLYAAEAKLGQAGPPTTAARPLSSETLANLWHDLVSARPSVAYPALWTLSAALADAEPFLRERLRQLPGPDYLRRLPLLLAALDDEKFAARQQAEEELRKLGRAAEPALRQLARSRPPLEVLQRVERLLEQIETLPPAADDQLRTRRALTVLETRPTAELRALLTGLAQGPADCWLTVQARASLERVKRP